MEHLINLTLQFGCIFNVTFCFSSVWVPNARNTFFRQNLQSLGEKLTFLNCAFFFKQDKVFTASSELNN